MPEPFYLSTVSRSSEYFTAHADTSKMDREQRESLDELFRNAINHAPHDFDGNVPTLSTHDPDAPDVSMPPQIFHFPQFTILIARYSHHQPPGSLVSIDNLNYCPISMISVCFGHGDRPKGE